MVVSSANLRITEPGKNVTQSDVNREYRIGDNTQPGGAPVFKVIDLDTREPIFTRCGRSKRKSKTHLQSEPSIPRPSNLLLSFRGKIVLKAELTSINTVKFFTVENHPFFSVF